MSYNKTTWQTGDKITAAKMNKIEDGIAAAEQSGGGYDLVIENDWENNKFPNWSYTGDQANMLVLRKGNFLDLEDKLMNNEPINAVLIWHSQISWLPDGVNIQDLGHYMRIQQLNGFYTYARFGFIDATSIRGSSSSNSIRYYTAEIYYDADTGVITHAYFGDKAI